MGKNKARHLLHGILDLLPVFVIPLLALAVRSDNNFSPISIEVQETKKVEFNQNVYNGNFENISVWQYARLNFTVNDNVASLQPTNQSTNDNYLTQQISMSVNHKYLCSFDCKAFTTNTRIATIFYANTISFTHIVSSTTDWEQYYSFFTCNGTDYNYIRLVNVSNDTNNINYMKNVMLFDLTLIFGEGNEPSSYNDFLQYFPNEYYVTQFNTLVIIDDVTTTYNDTDVGSQMVYTLYNTVDKYFNMGNVFGMNDVYDWFVLNIFGGTSSMSVYIVWNIVLYEFVMDLLFLLYGIFMFFIDMCKRLMEKPLNSIK